MEGKGRGEEAVGSVRERWDEMGWMSNRTYIPARNNHIHTYTYVDQIRMYVKNTCNTACMCEGSTGVYGAYSTLLCTFVPHVMLRLSRHRWWATNSH